MLSVRVVAGLVLTLGFSLGGQALLRLGVTRTVSALGVTPDVLFRRHLLDLLFSPLVIAGGVLSVVGAVCWLYVLAHYELSRALPLLGGMGYLVLFVVGRFWLSEKTSWLQLLGILLLVAGMFLITRRML